MIVGSIKENTTLEKRISITPESAKNIIGLGLKVCVEKGYAIHLGIDDKDYNDIGVEECYVINALNLMLKERWIKLNGAKYQINYQSGVKFKKVIF